MIRLILFSTLILFSINGNSQSFNDAFDQTFGSSQKVPSRPPANLLDSITRAQRIGNQGPSQHDCPDDQPAQTQGSRQVAATSSLTCPLEINNFCQSTEAYKEPSFSLNQKKQRITRRFRQLNSDRTLWHSCCRTTEDPHGSMNCIYKVQRAGIEVLKDDDVKLLGRQAAYFPSDNMFRISESRLNQADLMDIEHVLLHEYGHMCQHGLGDTERETKARLHPAVASCIDGRLSRFTGERREQYYSEIFADTIFSHRLNQTKQWRSMCRRRRVNSTNSHPSNSIYLDCLLRDPRVQNNFCSNR